MGIWARVSFPGFLNSYIQSLKTNSHVFTFAQCRQCILTAGPRKRKGTSWHEFDSCPLLTRSFWQTLRRHILTDSEGTGLSYRYVCTQMPTHTYSLSSHPQTTPLLPYLYILTRRFTLWDSCGPPFRLPFCFFPHTQQQWNIHFCRQICSLIPKCLSPAVCLTWVLVFSQ